MCREIQVLQALRKMGFFLLKTKVITARSSVCFVVASVGGLTLFLVIASLLLVSSPIDSTIRECHLRKAPLGSSGVNQSGAPFRWQQHSEEGDQGMIVGESEPWSEDMKGPALPESVSSQEVRSSVSYVPFTGNEDMDAGGSNGSVHDFRENSSEIYSIGSASSNQNSAVAPLPSLPSSNTEDNSRSCDLYHGKWIYDPAGPLYTKSTCPVLKSWNCRGNGRPDKDYENWRWRPDQCDLPRFDARKFLELMKGKTLAIIGDSLARNQMESMLCILWQEEAPKRLKKRNRRMRQWRFRSTSTTISIIWSAWLVRTTFEPLHSTTDEGLIQLHLDSPDETFMQFLPEFDIVVLSSGHWFFKQTAYLLNGEIMPKKQIDHATAYSIALKTALTAIATMANYTGLTIVRSFSPDHYAGGGWSDGNWCGKMDDPESKLAWSMRMEVMYNKQVWRFKQVVKKVRNGSKMRLMDITEAFRHRHDGHPGPYYRRFDENLVGKGGSNGNSLSKDCGHWCLPGPIDTWNEILFEIIRRES